MLAIKVIESIKSTFSFFAFKFPPKCRSAPRFQNSVFLFLYVGFFFIVRFSFKNSIYSILILNIVLIGIPSITCNFVTWADSKIDVWLDWALLCFLILSSVSRTLNLDGGICTGCTFNFYFGSKQ